MTISDNYNPACAVDTMIHNMLNEVNDAPDMVNHPPHYNKGGLEAIDVIDAFVEDKASYYQGNIIKYVLRYRNKNGVEDLEKARWYLNRLIEKEATK